ncbi:GNAT family N-acetyltransferase [Kribbella sp. NPDC006257]|uniref:GNAT family N-acetyltransferase n=1 Tax=Kribbella sp. NPDC006257 TaxID=3156738 RepID=UPI0033A0148E
MEEVSLRALTEDDLPTIFAFNSDPVAAEMVGMPLRDEETFYAHRARNMANPLNQMFAILVGDEVVGDLVSWPDEEGHRRVGYWLGRQYWGRGIATAALTAFLTEQPERPLYADVSKANPGSLRVLQKCGFRMLAEGEPGHGGDPAEFFLRLE